ncbi:MAG: hypothetical protein KC983_05650, partial [Phycisphaerales bacterium]|nr:hypothetical protein [Phycisphaerales bacterium]
MHASAGTQSFEFSAELASVRPAPTINALPGAWKSVLERMTPLGVREVQLSATQPGFRPRELDRSGRRDLLAGLRRHELTLAGLDAWIPAEHFVEVEHIDRAVHAMVQIIELAGDLGRIPVSFALPGVTPMNQSGDEPAGTDDAGDAVTEVTSTLAAAAERFGITLIDFALPRTERAGIAFGVDTAAALSHAMDPAGVIVSSAPATVRLSDLTASGMRGPIGRGGRLDIVAVMASMSVLTPTPGLVIDCRQ